MYKKLTSAKIQKIKELSKKGMVEREIAKKVGCSRSTVFYWKKK